MSENHDINTSNKTASRRPKQPLILLTILALTLVTSTSNGLYAERNFTDQLVMTLPGAAVILMLILTEWKGRRVLFMTLYVLSLLSSIMYLFRTESFEYQAISFILHAPVKGSAIALLYIVICEYCDPKRRFLFLVANSATQMLFYWIALTVQIVYREKIIGDYLQYLNVILEVFGLWSVFRWPESPYWLASKRRFAECEKAFVEVRGEGSESSEELRVLTDARPRPGSIKMIYAPLLIAVPVLYMSATNYASFGLYDLLTFIFIDTQRESGPNLLLLIFKCIAPLASVLTVLIPVALPRKVLFLACGMFFVNETFVLFSFAEVKIPIFAFIFEMILDYGPRTVTLPLLIELVPQKYVSLVTAFMTVMHVIMNYYLIKFDYPLRPIVEYYFILVMVVICYFIMPEVKEKPLIEIEQLYVTKKDQPLQSIQTDF